MKSTIIIAARKDVRFKVISNSEIRRIDPDWVSFYWDNNYSSFVSDTWDGSFNYHWMLCLINKTIIEIPAAFAPVSRYHHPHKKILSRNWEKIRKIREKQNLNDINTLGIKSPHKCGRDVGGL